jgi:hypothetical protein
MVLLAITLHWLMLLLLVIVRLAVQLRGLVPAIVPAGRLRSSATTRRA